MMNTENEKQILATEIQARYRNKGIAACYRNLGRSRLEQKYLAKLDESLRTITDE